MIASELGGALFVVPAIVRALANKRSDLYFRYEFCDEDAQYAGELIIEGGYEHGELEILKSAVEEFVELLNSKGRASIITFHSLEDRIVKNVFKEKKPPIAFVHLKRRFASVGIRLRVNL